MVKESAIIWMAVIMTASGNSMKNKAKGVWYMQMDQSLMEIMSKVKEMAQVNLFSRTEIESKLPGKAT